MKKRITFTLDEETIDELKKVSEQTMIPQARLVEQALKDIISKYKEQSE
jgi:predicted transcriptional regulator